MACTNREKETDWDTFFFEKKSEKKIITGQTTIKKIKKMPCYQGTGLGCPVALLAGFPSQISTTKKSKERCEGARQSYEKV